MKNTIKHISIADAKDAVIYLVRIKKIIYVKGDGNSARFFIRDKRNPQGYYVLTASKNLGYYADILLANKLERIHQSYIVNRKYVAEEAEGRILKLRIPEGHEVLVSENNHATFKAGYLK
ncbi:MAG: LytTR family transcriptional regulator DNA-binding domain-containing protein [Bacteroidia bacterium]